VSTSAPLSTPLRAPPQFKVFTIAARWNDQIVSRLLDGSQTRLAELGVAPADRPVIRVPGAFELPVAALHAARRSDVSAVIVHGCVIRGETWHFEAVAGQCAQGIREAALLTGKPVIFGVLTVDTEAQALERTGGPHGHAGIAAAEAAVEMHLALTKINSPHEPS
jgi:6,7-dimethyl-8-ribityllumazine synthase